MLRRTFLSTVVLALRKDRLDQANRILETATRSGEVAAASLYVRQGDKVHRTAFGKATPDTVFLIASISKPMTATGIMRLVDRRVLSLDDPVHKHIPEFAGADRASMTLRHLLTHTSGLPDMLPENDALRKRHAPLSEFVALTCKTPLLFKPGTQCRYQSMGILLAAEIAQRVTRKPFRDYLQEAVFGPLAMTQTSLGLGGRKIADTAQCQVTGNDDWNWNSPYWRNLGSPWGGVHSTASDIALILEYFLHPTGIVLRPATAASMIVDQNRGLNRPYGIGWAVGPGGFPKECSGRVFGHGGSTGTTSWADPVSDTAFVLLTTLPAVQSGKTVLRPVADAIAEAAA
jgi:CubicO group peptidase (beta-lactamase class C family)